MKIENLDRARMLGSFRDTLLSMKRHLSEGNKDRRIRVHLNAKPDDAWDDVSSDGRLLELVEQAIDTRLKEVEEQILNIE
jgi:hypothetical protein